MRRQCVDREAAVNVLVPYALQTQTARTPLLARAQACSATRSSPLPWGKDGEAKPSRVKGCIPSIVRNSSPWFLSPWTGKSQIVTGARLLSASPSPKSRSPSTAPSGTDSRGVNWIPARPFGLFGTTSLPYAIVLPHGRWNRRPSTAASHPSFHPEKPPALLLSGQ